MNMKCNKEKISQIVQNENIGAEYIILNLCVLASTLFEYLLSFMNIYFKPMYDTYTCLKYLLYFLNIYFKPMYDIYT